MPQTSRDSYADKFIAFDDEAQQVEEVLGDITDNPSSFDELTAARLDNLKARTSLINQKLEEQKERLWAEWNAEFFEVFTEAFAKYKNDLISLHLSEEQLNVLNEKLDGALKIMQDKLDAMWNRFNTEETEEQ